MKVKDIRKIGTKFKIAGLRAVFTLKKRGLIVDDSGAAWNLHPETDVDSVENEN